jgi:hypothetical protein
MLHHLGDGYTAPPTWVAFFLYLRILLILGPAVVPPGGLLVQLFFLVNLSNKDGEFLLVSYLGFECPITTSMVSICTG